LLLVGLHEGRLGLTIFAVKSRLSVFSRSGYIRVKTRLCGPLLTG
jgi:hypothetical protein